MKRFAFLLYAFVFCILFQCFANATEFQPAPYSKSNIQDRVWSGTFQLLWNDFKNRVVFDNVRFSQGTPIVVQELNMFSYSPEYIPGNCYYKTITKVTKSARKNIIKNIKKQFNETSSLLENVELKVMNDRLLLYSLFKEDCIFVNVFDDLGTGRFGEEQNAAYFGVSNTTKNNYRENIDVLFYNSPYDFAVKIKLKGNSYLYLYKTPSNKSFCQLYEEMLQKEKLYYGDKKFSEIDELKIPYITFNRDYLLEELCNKRIKGTNLVLDNTLAGIRFTMLNTGEKLKITEGKEIMRTALTSEVKPRLFYLDSSFALFLRAKNQPVPYFGLRINDITNYQQQTQE